jgi:hypothetical protein
MTSKKSWLRKNWGWVLLAMCNLLWIPMLYDGITSKVERGRVIASIELVTGDCITDGYNEYLIVSNIRDDVRKRSSYKVSNVETGIITDFDYRVFVGDSVYSQIECRKTTKEKK